MEEEAGGMEGEESVESRKSGRCDAEAQVKSEKAVARGVRVEDQVGS
jgi:hypothetical protein